MAVFVVVPGHEISDPALRVVLAGEPRCWPVRPVLAGAEQGIGEWIIIADPRPAVGGDDAEPREGGLHGRALHRAAVVGVQDKRAGEAALGPDRLTHEIGGQLGSFALVDLPADDHAAVDVEEQVEVEEPAPDRAGHPGDVPTPDLARAAGAVAGRRALEGLAVAGVQHGPAGRLRQRVARCRSRRRRAAILWSAVPGAPAP